MSKGARTEVWSKLIASMPKQTPTNKFAPFQRSHPTLKACKCGFIGTRSSLYRHFDEEQEKLMHLTDRSRFFAFHGEVPLNINDPKVKAYELDRSEPNR